LDRGIRQLGRGLDVYHGHPAVAVHQQQVGNMPTDPALIRAYQLQRLRRDRHDVRIEVRQRDPSQFEPTLVHDQPLDSCRPVPARVVAPALVPAKLPNRQPGRNVIDNHAV
jgi:hypothetical protein